jgi:hypothetical protein
MPCLPDIVMTKPATLVNRVDDPVGQSIIVMKATGRARKPRSRFAVLGGTAGTGLSTDEIMALTRDPNET